MGNYIVRTTQGVLGEKFRVWRKAVADEKHKQGLIKKTFEHCKRHRFDIAARAFKKMINRARAFEFQNEIR